MGSRWLGWLVPLLFVASVPPGAGQDAAGWGVTDPTGDVHHWLAREVPAPPVDLMDLIDLTSLSMRDENGTAFTLVLEVKDLDATKETVAAACAIYVCNRYGYDLSFTLNGDDRRVYYLYLSTTFIPVLYAEPETYAYFTVDQEGGDPFRDDMDEPAVVLDDDANEVRITFDKLDLVVGSGSGARPPTVGDKLTDLAVASWMSLGDFTGIAVRFVDEAPDEETAPPYGFASPTWNARLMLETEAQYERRLDGGAQEYETVVCDETSCRLVRPSDTERVGVLPGSFREVPVFVTNRADEKRVINLTATVAQGDAGWTASVVPTLLLGPNETQQVTALVQAPATAQHRDGGVLTVVGRDLADERGVGGVEVIVEAVRTPSPTDPVLYLHSRTQGFSASPFNTLVPPYVLAMNTARTDDVYDDGAVPLGTLRNFGGFLSFRLDTALGQPLRLDPEGEFTLRLRIASELPTVDARLSAELILLGDTDELLASGDDDVTLTSAGSEVVLTFPPAVETGPDGVTGDLLLRLELSQDVGPTGFITGMPFRGSLDVAASDLTMPLLSPQASQALAASKRISLHLQEDRDEVEYVNPGEARAFNLSVLNEEASDLDVRWSLKASDKAWTVWTDGATKARVASGNASALRVWARAPLAGEEGQRLEIVVAVAPAGAKGETPDGTNMTLEVIVTKGIDLPDDTPAGPALATKSKKDGKVPGPGLGLGLAAVAVAAWVSRRHP